MKKAIIAIVALLAAAGVSIGAFMAVKTKSDKETKQEELKQADFILFDFESDAINKIDISSPEGDYTFEYENMEWNLTQCSGTHFDTNQTKVQGIVSFMAYLQAKDSYGEATEENKAKYGLDNPYVVTLSGDTEPYVLYLGNKSPTGEYYYGYTSTKNNVYAIPSSIISNIYATRLELKNNNFVPYSSSEIIGLELVRDGEVIYTLDYDTENRYWHLPDEYEMLSVDQTKVTSTLAIIARLTAEVMLPEDENDITTYGFDKPIAEFTVKGNDGTEKTLLFSKYGQDAQTYTYVYNQEAKQVETFYAGDLDFIDKTPIDFVMKKIECANLYSSSEFEIISEDINVEFTLNANEEWAKYKDNDIDLSNANTLSYFENFFNTFAYIGLEKIDVVNSPNLENPILTTKFTDINDKFTQVDFVESDNSGLCYVFVNGEYTGTLTSTEFINGDDSISYAFDLFCQQAGIEK
ncbi:MAG: DUF4340 domain-containing protein [Ruminococcus sp.]|nr:DUF4340 domain-containing protein [Ruminococcus sp.]